MAPIDPLLAARSALALTVRHDGSPEAIKAAQDALALAKAERLERDAAVLRSSVRDASRVLINSYANDTGVSRELHNALVANQREESDGFKAEHGAASGWPAEVHVLWTELLNKHTDAHVALGCSTNASCLMTRTRHKIRG